jgi:hypothetical protein
VTVEPPTRRLAREIADQYGGQLIAPNEVMVVLDGWQLVVVVEVGTKNE